MGGKILKYPITFKREKNIAEEGYAEDKQWCFFKQTYADVDFKVGGTTYFEEGPGAFTRVVFTIRYDEDIKYEHRIHYDNQIYIINHIQSVDRKHWMKITSVNWFDDTD